MSIGRDEMVNSHQHLDCMQTLAAHKDLESRHAEVQQQHTDATGQATTLQQDLASANARSASHISHASLVHSSIPTYHFCAMAVLQNAGSKLWHCICIMVWLIHCYDIPHACSYMDLLMGHQVCAWGIRLWCHTLGTHCNVMQCRGVSVSM